MERLETRRGPLNVNSFDPQTRTFIAVAATDTPVKRSSYGLGDFSEVLSMAPKAVRLDRLLSGRAPVLDSHRGYSVNDQIGVVTGARVERGQLVVDGKLSSRDDEQMNRIAADMEAGIIKNVSVGYRVHESKETRDGNGRVVVTHTSWEPFELSLVAVPADPQAYIRSSKGNQMDRDEDVNSAAEIETTDDVLARANDTDPPATPTMSDWQAREAYDMAARHGMSAAFVRQHIEAGGTLPEFRRALSVKLAKGSPRMSSRTGSDSEGTFDDPEFLGRAIAGAIYARLSGAPAEGAAVEWRGRSLLDMGAALLQQRGERVSWSSRDRLASQIMTRSGSTSDFPVLLSQAGGRVLMDAYKAAQSPLKPLARRRDAVDFRAISMVRLSEAPRLLKVKEGGEVTYGARSEAKESFKLETFARIFTLTRQAIINDDLGAFADSNVAWGRAAADTEADQLASLFTANAGDGVKLDDGTALYAVARNNKAAAGGAMAVATLSTARQAMRETKGLDGKTPISITPKVLVVGPAKETQAEQFLATLYPPQADDVNPFGGKLTLAVEPRFSGNAWRLFADPAEHAVIQIAYLNGADGPILETRDGWDTLGAEFRAVLDFGCGISDFRGTYLNSGD